MRRDFVWAGVFCLAILLCGCQKKEAASSPPAATGAADAKAASAPAATERSEPSSEALPAPSQEPTAQAADQDNHPPRITAVPFKDPHVHAGMDIEVAPEAEDPEFDLVSFSYQWFVNGEPLPDIDGPVLPRDHFQRGDAIAVRVTPSDGKIEGASFTSKPLTIPDAPPVFVTQPPTQFTEATFSYAARAEDPDGDSLSYSLASAPQGMTIDPETGLVQWPLDSGQKGRYEVRIVVQDNHGQETSQSFALTLGGGQEKQQ